MKDSLTEGALMIPKILHIIWIGDESRRPDQLIDSWRLHHPDWDVRVWGNEQLLQTDWRCRHRLHGLGERDCAAVADAMRWEILLQHGGVCVAADSVCLRPLDPALLDLEAFTCWENEVVAPGQLCAAYVGCTPGNPLIAKIVQDIAHDTELAQQSISDAVGSGRLTRTWRDMAYDALTVLPSACFVPRHPRAASSALSIEPFACELWASSLGILPELAHLNAAAIASVLGEASRQPVGPTINLVLMTIRFDAKVRSIIQAAALASQEHPGVRLTVADGSMDASKAAWVQQLAERTGADIALIQCEDIRERLNLAVQDAFEWTLFMADDDPFTVNYLEAYIDKAATVGHEVAAIAPSVYLGLFGHSTLPRTIEPMQELSSCERLGHLYRQDLVQCVLYYSLTRTGVVRQWLGHVSAKAVTPSYTDHLLTSLVAASGAVVTVDDSTVLVRDESNWATKGQCVLSDMRFYPHGAMVLFHETFWSADLIRLLAQRTDFAQLLPALKPRVVSLLAKQFNTLELRASMVKVSSQLQWRELQMAGLQIMQALDQAETPEAICEHMADLADLSDRVEAAFLAPATLTASVPEQASTLQPELTA
jgi:hypothetical protein